MNGEHAARPWNERLSRTLIQRAGQALPTYDRERYREEWQAELDAHPGGPVSRLTWALGLFLLRRRLARALGARTGILSRSKGFDFALAARSLALAPRDDRVDVVHGYRVADPYRWLEDAHTVDTERWQAAQDELYEAHRAVWPSREAFRQRIGELLATGVVGAPAWRGPRQFFTRRQPGQEHAVLYVDDGLGERALIDPLALDPTGTTTLDGWHPSKEGNLLAYRISRGGTEESDLYVLDVTTGEVVDGPIDRTRSSSMAWLPGEKAFYYVRRLAPDEVPAGEAQYHRRVWLHQVGASANDDVLVFGAGFHRATWFDVDVSHDGGYLLVSSTHGAATPTNQWIANPGEAPKDAPDLASIQLGAVATTALRIGRDGKLYVRTDLDAPRRHLCVTDPAAPTGARPARPAARLDPARRQPGHDARPRHTNGGRSACWSSIPAAVPKPGSATPTTPRRRRSGGSTPVRRRASAGPRHPIPLTTCLRSMPGRSPTPRLTARPRRCSSSARPAIRRRPGPRSSTRTAVFAISLTPAYTPSAPAWIEANGIHRRQPSGRW